MEHITGLMVYYYIICQRKLWYFYHNIKMEQNSELVAIGKILDENSYTREKKSILIDETIQIDFIKEGVVLHEVKKTKSIEEAGIWQVKYYMYYLEKKGVKDIKAQIDYPLLRETKEIVLEEEDKLFLEKVEKGIKSIIEQERPPKVLEEKLCKKCSYYDLCYI